MSDMRDSTLKLQSLYSNELTRWREAPPVARLLKEEKRSHGEKIRVRELVLSWEGEVKTAAALWMPSGKQLVIIYILGAISYLLPDLGRLAAGIFGWVCNFFFFCGGGYYLVYIFVI